MSVFATASSSYSHTFSHTVSHTVSHLASTPSQSAAVSIPPPMSLPPSAQMSQVSFSGSPSSPDLFLPTIFASIPLVRGAPRPPDSPERERSVSGSSRSFDSSGRSFEVRPLRHGERRFRVVRGSSVSSSPGGATHLSQVQGGSY